MKFSPFFVVLFAALLSPVFLTAGDCDEIPTALTVDSVAVDSSTGGTAWLSWNAMPNAQNYIVVVQNGKNNPFPFLATATVTANSFVITGLLPDYNYKFKVRTRCMNGDKSNWARWKSFNSTGSGACEIPLNLSVATVTDSSADFTWDVVPAAIRYDVKVEDANNNPFEFRSVQAAQTNASSVTGLVAGQTYKVRIRTRCLGGDKTNWSGAVFFSTTSPAPISVSSVAERNAFESSEDWSVVVWPNPVREALTVQYENAHASDMSIRLLSLTGQAVFSSQITANEGNDTEVLELPSLPSGLYLLETEHLGQVKVTKVLVQQ